MTDNAKRASLAVALLVGGATLLAGCATVSDLLSREVTHHYEDTAAMAESDTAPQWVPEDATDITLRTPADADSGISVVLLTSESSLPESCVQAPRSSAPILSIADAPDVYKAQAVSVCGDWSVIPGEGGWYGWTPNPGDAPE